MPSPRQQLRAFDAATVEIEIARLHDSISRRSAKPGRQSSAGPRRLICRGIVFLRCLPTGARPMHLVIWTIAQCGWLRHLYSRVDRRRTGSGVQLAGCTQYDASEAYIRSQAHAGWSLIKTRYDDGGFSGGSTNRPAFRNCWRMSGRIARKCCV